MDSTWLSRVRSAGFLATLRVSALDDARAIALALLEGNER